MLLRLRPSQPVLGLGVWVRPLAKVAGALVLATILASPFSFAQARQEEPIEVLVLFYGNRDAPAFVQIVEGFRAVVESGQNRPVYVLTESFDSEGGGRREEVQRSMLALLETKYAARNIRLVIAIGEYPLEFLLAHREHLFPHAGLLYVLIGEPARSSFPGATGVVIDYDLTPTAELALAQNPGTRRLLIILGASPPDKAVSIPALVRLQEHLERTGKRVELQTLGDINFDEARRRLSTLPKDTVAIFASYYADSAGQAFIPARVVKSFSLVSSRPMYGIVDATLGRGVVGGSLFSSPAVGERLGQLALRVLAGEQPDSIPPAQDRFQNYAFDFRELQRWGIGLDQLPAGSIVENREYTVWELYGWYIVAAVLLIAVQTALIVFLLYLRRVRRRAEFALAESEQFKGAILASLTAAVAVVDRRASIVAVNERWKEFACSNQCARSLNWEGQSYFQTCPACLNSGLDVVRDGVLAVCEGRRDFFEIEYPCPAGAETLWLQMSATPLKRIGDGAVIAHRDITSLKKNETAIRELSGLLITAQEQERSRIARELHDDINQQLALLAIELQRIGSEDPDVSSPVRERLESLWKRTHDISTDVQRLSHQLHSTKLAHLGIVAALRGLCQEFSRQYSIEVDFQAHQVPAGMESDLALTIFRVAQEALRNVAKHSNAHAVLMELSAEGVEVVLRVSDDGAGFDPSAVPGHSGLGMISMRERLRLARGNLSIWSRPGLGTQIEARAPLDPTPSRDPAIQGTLTAGGHRRS